MRIKTLSNGSRSTKAQARSIEHLGFHNFDAISTPQSIVLGFSTGLGGFFNHILIPTQPKPKSLQQSIFNFDTKFCQLQNPNNYQCPPLSQRQLIFLL